IWPLRLRPVTDPLSPMFAFRRKLCTPRKNGAGTRGTIPALGKVLPVRVYHDLDPLEFLEVGVTGSGHGTAQRTHEVHGAVTGVGGAVQDGPQVTDRADLHPLTTRQLVVVRLAAPVVTTPGCLFGAGQGRADHHGIGPACQGFGDVPTAGHAAVGDDVYVTATGLVEVVAAGSGHITDGAGHRHGHTQYGACGVARTTTETDQDTRGASTHQVQGGVDDRPVVLGGVLRGQPCGRDQTGAADLLDPASDQLFLDRSGVDFLEALGGRLVLEFTDFLEQRLRVFVPGPEPLQVQH